MADKELTARVRVEADDAQPIGEIVRSISGMAPAAESAGAGVEKLGKNLADVKPEAVKRIKAAVDELAKSTSGAAGEAKLAERAYEALGGSPVEFIGRTADATQRAIILLADLQKNIDQVDEESREGLSGFADRAAKARQRVAELNALVEGLGEDELPEVRAELRRLEAQFEKTFETGARRAANLEAEIERTEDQLKILKDRARAGQGGVNDLGDAFGLQFPKMAKAVGGVVAAFGALKESYQQTREGIELVEKVFGVNIDKMVTKALRLEEVGEFIVNFGEKSENVAEDLRNQQRIFDNLNLDGFSNNVEKNAELLEQHFARIGNALMDLRANATTLLDRLELNPEKLIESAKAIAEQINAVLQVEPDIDLSVLRDRLQGELDKTLEGLIIAGEPIPVEFLKIIGKMNEAAGDFNADNLIDVIENIATKSRELAELEAPGILKEKVQALIDRYEDLGEKAPPRIKIIRDEIQALIDRHEQLGEEVPPHLFKLVDALSVVSSRTEAAVDEINEILGRLPGDAKANAAALTEAWESFDPSELRRRFAEASDASREELREKFLADVEAIKAAGGEVSQEMVIAGQQIGALVSAYRPVSEAAGSAASAIREQSSAAAEAEGPTAAAAAAARDYGESVEAVGQKAGAAGDQVKDAASKTSEAGEDFRSAAEGVSEGAGALGEQAEAAEKAAGKLGEASSAAKNVSTSQDAMAESTARSVEELGRVGGKVNEVRGALDSLSQVTLNLDVSQILSALDLVISKASEARSAVESVGEAGEAA